MAVSHHVLEHLHFRAPSTAQSQCIQFQHRLSLHGEQSRSEDLEQSLAQEGHRYVVVGRPYSLAAASPTQQHV